MDNSIKDPVCGMQVNPDSFATDYLGMHYAFCSEQCWDRFKANPHLYVGVPGEEAPRQKGMEVIKQRHFHLDQKLIDAEAALLEEQLSAMMGIKHIEVAGDTIDITYDLLLVTAEQIETCVGQTGMRLGTGLGERLQRGFIHDFEEIEIDSMEVRPRPLPIKP
ncbi:MAG: YHS domain-containing protein [Sulfuriferula sp.]